MYSSLKIKLFETIDYFSVFI